MDRVRKQFTIYQAWLARSLTEHEKVSLAVAASSTLTWGIPRIQQRQAVQQQMIMIMALSACAGRRVLGVQNVSSDPKYAGLCEAGFFDMHPQDDQFSGGGTVAFLGTWSHYAYFKSGYIFLDAIERGSFVVKMTRKECEKKVFGPKMPRSLHLF